MKKAIALIFALWTSVAISGVALELEVDTRTPNKKAHMQKVLDTDFGKVQTLEIPDSNQEVEFKISKEIPNDIVQKPNMAKMKDGVLVQIDVFEKSQNERKKISSARTVTTLDHQARMERYDLNQGTDPVLQVKIRPIQK